MDPIPGPHDVAPSDAHDDPSRIVAALETAGLTIAVAESCTGGLLGAALTEISGASSYFMGGVIVYDNAAKEKLLGVPRELLEGHGAVSAEVAGAMARGAREALTTNLALAVTGIAGPTGGTPHKPVGTTYVSLSARDANITRAFLFEGDRASNRAEAVRAALTLLADYLTAPRDS